MKLKTFISSSLLLLSIFNVLGWGQKGHDVTAAIAERHLTPATLDSVTYILNGKSMVYYSNWPDNACHTDEYAYTKTWHYKNIDADQTYQTAPIVTEGDIVTAINQQVKVLKDSDASKEDKWLALVLTVHLLGDIHQPMHMGRASDRGGNQHEIKYFNSRANLHGTWDSKLPESAHKWSYTEWVDNTDRLSQSEIDEIISDGTPEKWGEETYGITNKVYEETPEGTNISYDYIANWIPVIENQFLRGGLRLADILNSVFDPSYSAGNIIK